MSVNELREALADLNGSEPVPTHLLVQALGWDPSYVELALSRVEQIGEMFGRQLDPEVKHAVRQLRSVLDLRGDLLGTSPRN